MSEAHRWLSLASQMIPDGVSLINAKRACCVLDGAARWTGPRAFQGVAWQFKDGSFLCADPDRVWVLAGREVVG